MLEVVDAMSFLKLNTLHVHLSDDDSFSFFVPAYPRLSATGCYSNVSHTHSPADLARLVAFARLRGVRVIPEFDTPAHFSTLINAYPEYMAAAGERRAARLQWAWRLRPRGSLLPALAVDSNNNSFLCLVDPSKEETFTFLAGVWAYIASVFPDAQVWKGPRWTLCTTSHPPTGRSISGGTSSGLDAGRSVSRGPASPLLRACWHLLSSHTTTAITAAASVTAWMTAQNYSVSEAYWYYERRIVDIARSLGRSVLAWQDIQGYNGSVTSLDVGEGGGCAGPAPCARRAHSRVARPPARLQRSMCGPARTVAAGRMTLARSPLWGRPSSYRVPSTSRSSMALRPTRRTTRCAPQLPLCRARI